jgi:hypothetical protein
MKTFLLPEQLGNALLNYLGKRPYVEVAAFVVALSQLEEAGNAPKVPLKIVPGEGKPE